MELTREEEGAQGGLSGIVTDQPTQEPTNENQDPVQGSTDETQEPTNETQSPTKETQETTAQPVPQEQPAQLSPWWIFGGVALAAAVIGCVAVKWLRKRSPQQPQTVTQVPSQMELMLDMDAQRIDDTIRTGAMQDVGDRGDQQDSYGIFDLQSAQRGLLAVVADGMGGLANGKLVSSTLVRCFQEWHRSAPEMLPQDLLLDTAIRSNMKIEQVLAGAQRSGSTLVAALVKDGYLHFLTVGDSRLYLYRGGGLLQLNREHIYQEELAVKAVNRRVALSQVRSDRQAHALTSYFGMGEMPHVDRNDEGIRLLPGDKLLLASDGVFGTLTLAQMEQAMALPPQEAADLLGQMVQEAGKPHQDNNTAVVVEV